MDEVEPWPRVATHDTVFIQSMDQCMTGAKDEYGYPVQKSTDWMANSEALLKPFRPYVCDGRHIHGHPTGKALEVLKHYSTKLCNLVVDGTSNWKTELRAPGPGAVSSRSQAFPTDASVGTDAEELRGDAHPPGLAPCHEALTGVYQYSAPSKYCEFVR